MLTLASNKRSFLESHITQYRTKIACSGVTSPVICLRVGAHDAQHLAFGMMSTLNSPMQCPVLWQPWGNSTVLGMRDPY